MSDTDWLKCDACNKELRELAGRSLQLSGRVKPSLFQRRIQLQRGEEAHRCAGCGWVNIYKDIADECGQHRTPIPQPNFHVHRPIDSRLSIQLK